jgi:FimV-like protein
MQPQNPILLYLYENLKPIITYLNTHPIAHYSLIATTFLLLAFMVLSLRQKKSPVLKKENPQDINAIAGDDVMSTQLDLAKAYIEMDRKKMAKKMLQKVEKQGSSTQQRQARQLLEAL